jgi:hypothetical protein
MRNLDEKVAKKYLSLKASAQNRGIDFNLSILSLRNVLNAKKCYYTGTALTYIDGHPNSLTIDRVDADKGYVTGNIVACSYDFNQRKGALSIADLKLLHRKLCI